AAGDLLIQGAAYGSASRSQSRKTATGEVGNWLTPTMGIARNKASQQEDADRQLGSQIVSLAGDIALAAGKNYRQSASQIMAVEGDLDVSWTCCAKTDAKEGRVKHFA
ncbi:MAG: hypothetical protein LBK55_06820, partial [Azoarcus sp.]|nr:hypothetical protein [Azoarcus sp.]